MTGHSAERGFDAFFTEHFTQVRRYAARRFGDNDAEDIAQETMLRAYAHIDSLGDGRPVLPWLRTVALRVGLDAQRRRRPESMEADQLAAYSCAVPDHTDDVAIRVDLGGLLHRALRRLSVQDREALSLHAVHGVGIEEIAARTGATSNAIRQRLFRARRNFGRYYAELGGSEYTVLSPAQTVRARAAAPVQRVAAAVQRVAQRPVDRFGGRAVAAAAALVTAGASLTLAPPHLAGPAARDRTATPPPAVTAAVPAALLPRTAARLPAARPGLQALPDVDIGALLGGSRPGLPFEETWESGLDGWTVRGAAAATDCTVALWTRCSLRLAPAPGGVAATRVLGAPLGGPSMVRYAVRGTGTTSSFELATGPATVTVTTTLDDRNAGRVVVSSSGTRDAASYAVQASSRAWTELWVLLDPGSRTVRVWQMWAGVPLAGTALSLPAPPRRIDAVTAGAPYVPGAGDVHVAKVGVAPAPACANGRDDDGDGDVDTEDPGCDNIADGAESPNPECSDGIDNDGDGLTDFRGDPSCAFQRGAETTACSNGLDDDGDGYADYPDDADCSAYHDDSEVPLCRDGLDNDADGTLDYPADPGCSSADDDTEWTCLGGAWSIAGIGPRPVSGDGLDNPWTGSVCVDPIERLGSFAAVRQAPAADVRGYLEQYRVTPPGGPPEDVLCVTLAGSAGRTDPCAGLGMTYVSRIAVLVDAADGAVLALDPAGRVDVCTAALMLEVRTTKQNPVDRWPVMLAPC
jgi:RNA polymerase sigma factor (sigma-70 family)